MLSDTISQFAKHEKWHEVLVVYVKSCAKKDKMSLISSATRYFDILCYMNTISIRFNRL